MKWECVFVASPYPASLLLSAVGVAVQAGEDGARRHQLAGLVPAVCVAQPGSVALTLLVQDRVQSANQTDGVTSQKRLLSSVWQISVWPQMIRRFHLRFRAIFCIDIKKRHNSDIKVWRKFLFVFNFNLQVNLYAETFEKLSLLMANSVSVTL